MRKKTKDIKKYILLVRFCKFVRDIFGQFGCIFFLVIYYLYVYFSNTAETLFPSLFHSLFLKPVNMNLCLVI